MKCCIKLHVNKLKWQDILVCCFPSMTMMCLIKSHNALEEQQQNKYLNDSARSTFLCICAPPIGPNEASACEIFNYSSPKSGPKNHDSQRHDRILRLFLRLEMGAIFSTIWGDFRTKLHRKPGEKGKNIHWRKQKNSVEKLPRNCRFLSLVAVERVLTKFQRMMCLTSLVRMQLLGGGGHKNILPSPAPPPGFGSHND